MANAALAKTARIHAKSLEIDGTEFPWFISEEGPVVRKDGVRTRITVGILIDGEVVDERVVGERTEASSHLWGGEG